MIKETAKTFIRDTFQNPFDKEGFIRFTDNLLNKVDKSKAFHARGYVPEIFKDIVKTYERLGTYTDPNGSKADVLIVYLQKDTSLDRARTAQRNFAARYLKDRGGKDAGLIAFVPPDSEDWRFSLVKMEYRLEETGGKIKAKEELTPARRWSFLVGKNENSHTAQRQLLPLLENDEYNPHLSDFEEAFNIETVTKEFFAKYRDLFLWVEESLTGIVKKDAVIAKDFSAKGVDTVNFSKKLLGQIVFLYFLQKKGWFGVKRGKDWGGGSKHFLRELFKKEHGGYKNFFNDILEPLFYEALRLERPADYYSRFECRIPFLNGGLFDPINDYNWQDTDILLPNDLFSNSVTTKDGDKGTGILDVFDRYNFTVKEDEPLEKEVAIDPEMLGKVFENLLEVKDRKSKGTYYTPREIVHYMCQESLINYLRTELNPSEPPQEEDEKEITQEKLFGKPEPKQMKLLAGKQKKNEAVSREDIETLIKYGETAVEHDSRVINEGRETETYSFKLPESIRSNAQLVDEKLSCIRVCDPAVGSGAFLVGMMNEIVRARNALTNYLSVKHERATYDFKRHAIQSCLYGVDIDAGATEIAKLRLWLSLVVDEDDIKQIKPLPNLDYKIVCGNSLLGVEQDLTNVHLFDQLEKLKPLHFNETSAGKKQKYKQQIDALIQELTHNETKFDFEIYFSEIFHEKKGFDVVIANPPYVRVDEIDTSLKNVFKKVFKTTTGKYDLYYLFFEKALSICSTNSNCVFISPNKYCAASSAKGLRDILLKSIDSGEILSTSRLRIFEAASNYPIITILKLGSRKDVKIIVRQATSVECLGEMNLENGYIARVDDFSLLPNKVIPINISSTAFSLIKRLYRESLPFGKLISISEGLRIPQKLEFEEKQEHEIVKQYQFERYSQIRRGTYVSKKNLGKILSRKSDRYTKIFQEKILIAEDALRITTTLDSNFRIPQGGVYFAISINNKIDLRFLLGILNSTLTSYIYEKLFSGMHMGGGYLRYRSVFIEGLPVPKKILGFQKSDHAVFITLVDKILAITKDLPSPQGTTRQADSDYLTNTAKKAKVREYEREIDELVYKLYELTPEEIKIVENKN